MLSAVEKVSVTYLLMRVKVEADCFGQKYFSLTILNIETCFWFYTAVIFVGSLMPWP